MNNIAAAEIELQHRMAAGAEAAGEVPADLGEPDEHGVYTHSGATGTIYFRQCQHCGSGGISSWEFSTDRAFWIPACHADSLWYAPDGSPSSADKLLIQRLEVEAQLTARQGRCASASCGGATELPPLDLPAAAAAAGDGVGGVALSQVPPAFLCPISMQIMTQPVVTPSGGSFNRPALMEWIRQHHTDPVSGAPLRSDQVFPNLAMRDMIHEWASSTSDDTAAMRGRGQRRGRAAAVDSASSSRASSPFKGGRDALYTV
ncbi:hypothetical protein OEZ86_008307 [Tetradesmus obliquus]|nr:hypothetical protein OEZ86_008307 [Tetradesmus obliquus]